MPPPNQPKPTPTQRKVLAFLAEQGPALFASQSFVSLAPKPEGAAHGVPVVRGQKVLFNSLLRHDWIESTLEPEQEWGHRRILYRITDAGREALKGATR